MNENSVNFDDDIADELEEKVGVEDYSAAVLYGTDWTVKTILQQLEDGNIELTPDFQRRDAWPERNKSRFIESIVLQMPIPQIVLAEKRERRGTYIVLDGKQRLITLAQFAAGLSTEHPALRDSRLSEPLKLSTLKILTNLNGKRYSDFESDPELANLRTQFDNHTIRSSLIRNWPNEDYLYEVFMRLNTGSTKLSTQELRQAMKPGEFTDFLSSFSADCVPLQRILNLSGPDYRMRDVDLLLRMLAFTTEISQYRGNLKGFLDGIQQHYNKTWATDSGKIQAIAGEISNSLDFLIDNFGSPLAVGRKPDNEGNFSGAINRALLDVQLASVMEENKDVIRAKNISLPEITRKLCIENREFYESISSTTKTIDAINTRFNLWKSRLEAISGDTLNMFSGKK